MFSNIVTAAKGLFARPDSEEASATATSPTENNAPSNPKMVTTTRQRNVPTQEATTGSDTSTPLVNGKRKAGAANSGKTDGQANKRRRRSSLEMSESMENGSIGMGKKSGSKKEQAAGPGKNSHVRFGSEEPEEPDSLQADEAPEPQQGGDENGDESSDDDAPEAIDNSAQMSRIKAESQRLQKVKQRETLLKKEKRRQLDERRKLQAKLTAKKLETGSLSKSVSGAPGDDLVSESTETLQGSTTHDSRRPALPALLPDEILNAAPAERAPTPPPADETGTGHKKPNKLKFLDKVEKPPKDVNTGDVTIRVLDEPTSQKKTKPSLAPKASKTGRNSKENWLKSNRSTARVNGLRRTAGGTGSSSFVRR